MKGLTMFLITARSCRLLFAVAFAFCIFFGSSVLQAADTAGDERPNLIFIMADDLGYGDLGCFGQKLIKTPRLDQMAKEGIRLTQHYAGCTVCAPSRCSLMTGLHTGHTRVRGNNVVQLQPEDITIAQLLRDAGYRTACIGKWGVGHPPPPGAPRQAGFDYFFGYLDMWHAHNYYPPFLWKNAEKFPLRNIPRMDRPNGAGVAEKKIDYAHDFFTKEALDFVERAKDAPFFLYLPYNVPHANNEAGREGMEVPDLGIYADRDWPAPQKGHAAMISRLDGDVGRLLDLVDSLDLGRRTLVIFTSDNGPHSEGGANPAFFDSNGPLRGMKRDFYDGGVRVPFIARWTGRIAPGTSSDHISAFWDLMPTACELAGIAAPEGGDGISYLPTLLGKSPQAEHEYLYWEFKEQGGKQGVRLGPYKGVRLGTIKNPEGPIELYDLRTDIGEQKNIAAEHPEIVARIEKIMKEARGDETVVLKRGSLRDSG